MNPLMNEETALSELPPVSAWLSDMDGVLVKENRALPGANEFLAALRANEALVTGETLAVSLQLTEGPELSISVAKA